MLFCFNWRNSFDFVSLRETTLIKIVSFYTYFTKEASSSVGDDLPALFWILVICSIARLCTSLRLYSFLNDLKNGDDSLYLHQDSCNYQS